MRTVPGTPVRPSGEVIRTDSGTGSSARGRAIGQQRDGDECRQQKRTRRSQSSFLMISYA